MKANRKEVERLLKTARGQIDGVLKMLEEDRYCIDISNQLMASQAVLKRANKEIIGAHMRGCVEAAITEDDKEKKIEEMIKLIDELLK